MKNIKTIIALITLLILYFSGLQAGNGPESPASQFSKKVKSSIKTPSVIREKHLSQKVKVYFSVNEKGEVTEVFADSSSKEVKKDLEEQFLHFTFPELKPCGINSVEINFVVY